MRNPIPSQKLLEQHALGRGHHAPGDDDAWGTPWKPEASSAEQAAPDQLRGWLDRENHQSGLVYRFVERAVSPDKGSQLRESRHEYGHAHWYGSDAREEQRGKDSDDRATRLFGATAAQQAEAETHSWDYLETEVDRIQAHVEKHPSERAQRQQSLQEKEKELRELAKQLGLDHDRVGKNASILTGALGPHSVLEDKRRSHRLDKANP